MIAVPRAGICFHGIGSTARNLEPGEASYWISVRAFHDLLDEVATWPEVSLSWDDGNASDVEIALPALQERGLRATFFVLAGRLDCPGSLASSDIAALHRAGMTIGTHGMDHRPWRAMDASSRHRELVEARASIAAAAGADVDQAALPLGRYDRGTLGELRRLGYRGVHCSDRRVSRPSSWLQPRFSVRSGDSAASIRAAVVAAAHPVRRLRLEAAGVVKSLR